MSDTLPAFFSSGSKRILLLLEIDATELEARDCTEIYKYVRQTGKANIKFDTLGSLSFNSGDIPVNKIPFIQNMLKHRYCSLSNAQVEFSHRVVDQKGLSDFIIQLENRYKQIEHIAGTDTIHFPTNIFTRFAPGVAREMNLKNEKIRDRALKMMERRYKKLNEKLQEKSTSTLTRKQIEKQLTNYH